MGQTLRLQVEDTDDLEAAETALARSITSGKY